MVRVLLELGGHDLQQFRFDGVDVLPGRQSRAVRDPEDVGVDGDRRFAERGVQHDVRGLAADAGQGFQRLAVARHFAAVLLDEDAAGGDQVRGLRVVQADGVDVALQPGFAECQDPRRRVRHREQFPRRLVDADVGGLRREQHGGEQLEGRGVFELGGRMRVQLAQAAEELDAVGGFHRGHQASLSGGASRVASQRCRAAISSASRKNAPTGSVASRKPR